MIRHDYALTDRYLASSGEVFMTGVQALARIPIEALQRDRAAGLDTAAFVSGYPGSPLGGFDIEMSRARATVPELPIVHLPAVNEELGASAVMGSQLAATRPDSRHDGVVGIWYGKAPGLDRATDALRHGVFAGSSPRGGALALVGDDPDAKSSTMPSSSDAALVDLHMPVLYPATVAECLELGLHGVAMSRATGLWSALKIVTPIADGTGTVSLPALERDPIIPTTIVDGEVWQCRPSAQFLGPRMVAVEKEFQEIRTDLALRYGIENQLNRVTVDPGDAWIGLISTGFTYTEVLEALRRLGLDDLDAVRACGIRLLQLRMPVPFDPSTVIDFARGLEEIFVIEEKNPTLERLVRDALYDTSMRPTVTGKTDATGSSLLPRHGRLDADSIAPALRARLASRVGSRLAPPPPTPRELIPLQIQRAPFFCSGCPHNWGTKAPEGAVVGMGTGCHGMTLLMDEERVGDSIGITAMGNEGAQWLGMAPFVETDHVFQNFGDGTYFHSGQVAVQAAIGAGANVTFKILYNHTVAMTGGQDTSHSVGPAGLASVLLTHGVKKVVITTSDPSDYPRFELPDGVDVIDRSRILEVQRDLAAIEGVTVLIHDQECAAELRRGRKRGLVERPRTRVVINHRICEGCGDCGDVSNCLSVQPIETPLGRKTQIEQNSCNLDYSCLQGDCPAFMTVEVDEAAADGRGDPPDPAQIPVADPVPPTRTATTVRMAGIGGTGVVTAAQVLGTASLLAGLHVDGIDQTGLSQKAGPVISDVTITAADTPRRSNLVGAQQADVVLAFDALVAAADGAVSAVGTQTQVFVSASATPTGRQVVDPAMPTPSTHELEQRFTARTSADNLHAIDTLAAAETLTGSAATANTLLLGAALQAGCLPVSLEAVREAIVLNAVAVDANLAALEWGRRLVADRPAVDEVLDRHDESHIRVDVEPLPADLADRVEALDLSGAGAAVVDMLGADLVDYQNRAYAERFVDLVALAARAGDEALTLAVARGFHKLLAYKDEYEVARLMLRDDGLAAAGVLTGSTRSRPKVTWHLHPPALRALGMKRKLRFGPRSAPLFGLLARAKRLRGTALDPFGRAELRRLERTMVDEYEAGMRVALGEAGSSPTKTELVALTELASLPETVRGYEDLKMKRAGEYRQRFADQLAELVR